MNLQTRYPTTPDEFLRWNEGREGKREFVRGRVVELMINVTRNHLRIATALVTALARRLDLASFDVGTADFGIKTSDGIRFPDVLVDRRTTMSQGTDLAATEPLFVAEILSPSSYGRDFVEKLSDYMGVPSLLHYLILSQDEPRVWLWTHQGDTGWSGPRELFGEEETVDLTGLGLSINLTELYAGVSR